MGIFGKIAGAFGKSKKRDSAGSFISFILLDDVSMDTDLIVKNLHDDWGITISAEDFTEDKNIVVSQINGMMATFSLMPAPVPNGEAIENAKTNFRWPDAASVAESHKAHILVAVLGGDNSLLDAAILLSKICASCLGLPNAVAINALGSVLHPDFYTEAAKTYIEEGRFPILNHVFFGIYSNDNGKTFCGYTFGMETFAKKELEILNSSESADDVLEFLLSVASYVIADDVDLKSGETVGFTYMQKIPVTISKGVAVSGQTCKMEF